MSEIARILHVATEKSLLIIDEIGRGTSTFDGLAIAWSIIESLHDELGARTLFATHYHELTDLCLKMKQMHNMHVEVGEENGKVVFLHSVKPGKASGSYGVEVARLAGVPPHVLNRATEILQALEQDPKKKKRFEETLRSNEQLSLFAAANSASTATTGSFADGRSKSEFDTSEHASNQSMANDKSAMPTKPYLDSIEKELLALDINTCSPMDALLKIKSLKEQMPESNHTH